ncbi:RIP metalloprotease RseP [Pseudomarimonas arenosa]|uniref:Zinc metalloprotease n=1 Tax=Pseudomarimonas arenosa TaxID=2774145 RepID=A0AAW3ZNB6_9GAMM|nr:RIP metalloprotease RseP [Pseudomarimonas arenosa]MBD8527228.1 RIP metalloprotease RseP [Pseudomarimonas arenosa]
MSEFFGSVWWLIVALGVLVTFHEFGHYWVARRCGVKVLRFSVGFGTPLWRRLGKNGTEFVVAALPLGGYVKMLDEREGEVKQAELPQAFTQKSVYQRFAIVFAGPLFNLILTLFLLWAMFLIGKGDYSPTVGRTSGIAEQAGLLLDDRILKVDGKEVPTWTHLNIELTAAVMDRRALDLQVADADGAIRQVELGLDSIDPALEERQAMRKVGLMPRQWMLPPIVGEAVKDGAAAEAGLRAGDRIISIDGQAIDFFDRIGSVLNAREDGGAAVTLVVERDGGRLDFQLQPKAESASDGSKVWRVGIAPDRQSAKHDVVLSYGPIDAIGASFKETYELGAATLGMLKRMIVGLASLNNLSGPISIAQFANASAQTGVAGFLFFLAVLSLSLCIMNLLPIPILDGGHLLYYLIEMIKGSPVSERMLVAGQYVGLVFLAGLMGLAFYNDIVRLVS